MKKTLLFAAVMVMTLLLGAQSHAQEVIINETFDAFTEGSEQEPATTDISGYSGKLKSTIGWNGKYVYEAGQKLKVADAGNLQTGYLSTLTATTNIRVTFDVKCIDSYGGGVEVYKSYSSAGTYLFGDNEWHTVTVVIASVSKYAYVKFEPYLSASGILIDNVKVEASDDFLAAPVAYQPVTATKTYFTAWWKAVTGADSYLLDVYSKSDAGNVYLVKDSTVTGTSAVVRGLEAGTTYYYTMRAKKGDIVSDYSNEIEIVEVVYDVEVPVALDATNVSADGFTANWQAVPDAAYYAVLLSRTTVMDEDKTVNIIEDDFSKVTTGTLTYSDFPSTTGNLDEYTKVVGWTSYMPCLAAGYMGLYPYSKSSGSYLRTPALDLSQAGGAFKLKVNMAETQSGSPVAGDTVLVRVYNGSAKEPTITQEVVLEGAFKDYELSFTCGTAETYVEIYYAGVDAATNKLFIDSISIAQDLKKGDSVTSLIETREVGNVTSCDFEVPLSQTVSYSYQVIAYQRTVVDGEIDYLGSDASNVIKVIYGGSTAVSEVAAVAPMSVKAMSGAVAVSLAEPATVTVFDTLGRTLASVPCAAGENRIAVRRGLAIVVAAGQAVKVAVK